MTAQASTVRIELPKKLYVRLQRIAKVTHRPIEEVLSSAIDVALPEEEGLPADLADELAAMNMFSDEALWAAFESSLSPAQQKRLEQLSHAAGERPLTKAESAELTELLEAYDRAVLRRARAMALLTHRGYELPANSDMAERHVIE